MAENARDHGLARRIGVWGLTASTINVVVGASIFAIPATMAASLGPYAPFAFVICALAMGAVTIGIAEGGSRVPTSGGIFGIIEAAFGPLAGYVAGTVLWFGNALSCGAIAAALADVVVAALPHSFEQVRLVLIVAVIGWYAFVNVQGVAHGVRLVNASTIVKMIPLAVFLIAGAGAMHGANFQGPVQTSGVGRALILALFAFTGMEGSLCASGEVSQPARTIPRALMMSLLGVTILYVGVQVVAQGVLGPELVHATAPLAEAMGRVSPSLRLLLLAGAGFSMFGWIGSDILGTPRMVFAFARDGLMPRALGRLHPRTQAPHIAIWCYSVIAMGLALSGTFAELAVLSALSSAALYIGGCAAAWKLADGGVALAGAPLNFRWLKASALVGIVSMAILIALASREEILGLLALMGVSAAIYLLLAWRAHA